MLAIDASGLGSFLLAKYRALIAEYDGTANATAVSAD
jgi:hypothetical protein